MPLGINDLKNVRIPAAWDGNELARLKLRDGTTYEQLVRDINDALTIINGSLTGGYLGNLFSLTTEPTVEYRIGPGNGFEDHTEYSQPDRQRAAVTGHMLPIKKRDRGMGWTRDFLEECRRSQIDADIASMAEDAQDAFIRSVWARFFAIEEEIGATFGLGATGVSVPFADGGVGTIPFIPVPKPDRMINAFTVAHTHYLRLNGIVQANLETAVDHLWEHGHDGPYELIVSLADVAAWQTVANITGFVPKGDALVQYGANATLAAVGAEYIGGVQTRKGFCRMYALGRLPTHYYGVTKIYGPLDQRNPLRVRWDEMHGWGVKLYTENVSLYPLTGAIGVLKHGVGIGEDRTGAVLVLDAAGGNYATPVIS